MRKSDAIEYFGSIAELARAIEQTSASVQLWGELVPKCRRARVRNAMRARADRLEAEAKLLREKADD